MLLSNIFNKKDRENNQFLCSLKDVSIYYGKNKILHNININIQEGKFYCIAGQSGSGKSSLLYLLAGLLKPKYGEYLFGNFNYYKKTKYGLAKFRRNNIGILFQDFRLIPFLNIEQNIMFPVYFSGIKIVKGLVTQLMSTFDILHRSQAYPHQISGGESQRVALARAMLLNPKLLLLDEVTGNLDQDTEKKVIQNILELKKNNLAIVCVTHSAYVMKQADELWKVENGTLIKAKKK